MTPRQTWAAWPAHPAEVEAVELQKRAGMFGKGLRYSITAKQRAALS